MSLTFCCCLVDAFLNCTDPAEAVASKYGLIAAYRKALVRELKAIGGESPVSSLYMNRDPHSGDVIDGIAAAVPTLNDMTGPLWMQFLYTPLLFWSQIAPVYKKRHRRLYGGGGKGVAPDVADRQLEVFSTVVTRTLTVMEHCNWKEFMSHQKGSKNCCAWYCPCC